MQPNNQDPQPQTPDSNGQMPVQPQRRAVIQPVSSEDAIRQAAASAAPTVSVSSSSPVAPNSSPRSNESDEYSTNSTLITEPLHPASTPGVRNSTGYSQQLHTSTTQEEQPKKSRGTLFGVIGFILLLVVAGAAWFFFFSGRISASDLVEASVQNTTYLRPKQWSQVPSNATSSFGDMKGGDGKSTALVSLNVSPQQFSGVVDSASNLESVRSQILTTVTEETVAPAFQAGGAACQSAIKLQKEADTSSTETNAGLYKLTASCDRNDGTSILKMRGVIGRDGYVRVIAVFAGQASWNMNEAAYQKILDSVDQS